MWETIISALVSALGSVGGSVVAKNAQERNQRMQNSFNVQQEQDAREFNSPASQLARMNKAGINPIGQNFQSVGNPVVSADANVGDIISHGVQGASSAIDQLGNNLTSLAKQNKELELKQKNLELQEKSVDNTCKLGMKQLEVMNQSIEDIRSQISLRGWQSRLLFAQTEHTNTSIGLVKSQTGYYSSMSSLNRQTQNIRGLDEYDSKTLLGHARNNQSYNDDLIREMRQHLSSKAQSYVYDLECQRIQTALAQMQDELRPWQKQALEAQYQQLRKNCMYQVNMLDYADKIQGWKFWSNEVLGTFERASNVLGNVSKLGFLKGFNSNYSKQYNYYSVYGE